MTCINVLIIHGGYIGRYYLPFDFTTAHLPHLPQHFHLMLSQSTFNSFTARSHWSYLWYMALRKMCHYTMRLCLGLGHDRSSKIVFVGGRKDGHRWSFDCNCVADERFIFSVFFNFNFWFLFKYTATNRRRYAWSNRKDRITKIIPGYMQNNCFQCISIDTIY